MRSISFSKDWNNKLNCKYFTTIRPERYNYERGKYLIKTPEDMEEFVGEVIRIKRMKISEIPNEICFLDAGMGFQELKQLFEKFYRDKSFYKGDHTQMVLLTIRRGGLNNLCLKK